MSRRKGSKPPIELSWQSSLLTELPKDAVKYRPNVANIVTILVNDPRWHNVLAYDDFAETVVTLSAPPWRPCDIGEEPAPGDWLDADTARLQCWLSDSYGFDAGVSTVLSGVLLASLRHRVHPVRDWLESLRWDAKIRLTTWLRDVMGADDSDYTRAVGSAWLISAVARAYRPGCKVDTVLVLEGAPGIFKSSVLRALAGDEFFLEMSISDVSSKDAMQVLRRKWLAEMPEIDGLTRIEQAQVKSYFSRQVDTYRESYGHKSRDFPRQTVFAATTNKHEWLADETGGTGRRMWPVKCAFGNVSMARDLREQLWAEARARYCSGELWHIVDPEIRDAERAEQEARLRVDALEERIAAWLAKPSDVGADKAAHGVTTGDVLAGPMGLDPGKWGILEQSRVGAILRHLGWIPGNPEHRNGARVRVYRPEPVTAVRTLNGAHQLPEREPDAPSEDSYPPKDLVL